MPSRLNRLSGGQFAMPTERKSQTLLTLTSLGDPNWSRRGFASS